MDWRAKLELQQQAAGRAEADERKKETQDLACTPFDSVTTVKMQGSYGGVKGYLQ
jgi:hypothetical protein